MPQRPGAPPHRGWPAHFDLGLPGNDGPKQFHSPQNVFVDEEDAVFVSDRENNRIRVFSADWRFRELCPDKTLLPCQG